MWYDFLVVFLKQELSGRTVELFIFLALFGMWRANQKTFVALTNTISSLDKRLEAVARNQKKLDELHRDPNSEFATRKYIEQFSTFETYVHEQFARLLSTAH